PASGKLLPLLPDSAAVTAAWNMNRVQTVQWLRSELDKQGTPGTLGNEVLRAALDVLQLAGDEGAFTVSGDATNGPALALALRIPEARKAAQGLSASLESIKAIVARGSGAVRLEDLPAVEHGGVAIRGFRLSPPDDAALGPAGRVRQPVSLQYAASDDTLFLASGTQGLAALKHAVDTTKRPTQPADKDDAAETPELPEDAVAALVVYPVRLAVLALSAMPAEAGLDAGKLSLGLPDDAATLSLRQTENLVALRLELPAAVPQAAYTFARRIEKANAARRAQANPEPPVPAPPPP
ncbi:MAG: hypothetical protein NTW87_37195, partial [Planctomycetota bacterium]|nr:hypothetical protein [Planctomycetota bacterium]